MRAGQSSRRHGSWDEKYHAPMQNRELTVEAFEIDVFSVTVVLLLSIIFHVRTHENHVCIVQPSVYLWYWCSASKYDCLNVVIVTVCSYFLGRLINNTPGRALGGGMEVSTPRGNFLCAASYLLFLSSCRYMTRYTPVQLVKLSV